MPVDPSAIRTWANAVTVGRLLISPLMFAIIPADNVGSWAATGLWFLLCLSDLVDGQLARKHGTTRSGAFLDPLADKVCVLGAMFILVSRGMFSPWLVGLIAAREIAISLYRVFAGAKGVRACLQARLRNSRHLHSRYRLGLRCCRGVLPTTTISPKVRLALPPCSRCIAACNTVLLHSERVSRTK